MTFEPPDAEQARSQLIERHLPLARSIARRYAASSEPFEDLEQTAYVGLVSAVDRYDPTRGSSFKAFAVPTILGELRRYFRDRTWPVHVPRSLQDLSLELDQQTDSLAARLGRTPTIREIAVSMGTSEEEVLEAIQVAAAYRSAPLLIEHEGDEEADRLGPLAPGAVDDGLGRAENRAALAPLLGILKPHEREIVLLRFEWDLTQHEIGRLVGVSQMGVSRILRRSLQRMREAAERG